ncbi:MAG: hypothetical protein AAF801_14430 [Pseudomonadota bacterium]
MRPEFSFRRAQASFDLIGLLQACDRDRLRQLGGPDLLRIVQDKNCRFEEASDEACYSAVAGAVLDAGEDAALAAAVLVANDLQYGLWPGDTRDLADFAAARIHAAGHVLRSAILRGLDVLESERPKYGQACRFLPELPRLTQEPGQILPALCKIAQAMDPATRKSVAHADYGDRSDQHFEALNAVLAREDCRFEKDETWCLSEVVELVAFVRSTPGFVNCTALLLANAILQGEDGGCFDHRWTILAQDYNALPPRVRWPISSGVRCLYEMDEDFMFHEPRGTYDPVTTPDKLIHYAPEICRPPNT